METVPPTQSPSGYFKIIFPTINIENSRLPLFSKKDFKHSFIWIGSTMDYRGATYWQKRWNEKFINLCFIKGGGEGWDVLLSHSSLSMPALRRLWIKHLFVFQWPFVSSSRKQKWQHIQMWKTQTESSDKIICNLHSWRKDFPVSQHIVRKQTDLCVDDLLFRVNHRLHVWMILL